MQFLIRGKILHFWHNHKFWNIHITCIQDIIFKIWLNMPLFPLVTVTNSSSQRKLTQNGNISIVV